MVRAKTWLCAVVNSTLLETTAGKLAVPEIATIAGRRNVAASSATLCESGCCAAKRRKQNGNETNLNSAHILSFDENESMQAHI